MRHRNTKRHTKIFYENRKNWESDKIFAVSHPLTKEKNPLNVEFNKGLETPDFTSLHPMWDTRTPQDKPKEFGSWHNFCYIS